MENKRKKLVIRNINEESTETEYIEDTLVEKMCSCEDDVAEKKSTSESVGACGDRSIDVKG